MKKPDSLRAHLTTALPELARDPEALSIYVTGGTIATRHGENLGFEMRYTLHLVMLNYRGAPEQIFLPVILWLRTNQAELLLNHDSGVKDIAFNVDVLGNDAVDVEITLPLTEAVDVLPDSADTWKMSVRDDQLPDDTLIDPLALLRQIWAPGLPASAFLVGQPEE